MRLAHKVAVITGAGMGIGRATAELFAREGARVAVVNTDAGRGREVVEGIRAAGGEAVRIGCDVSCSADVQRMVREALDAFERIDVLVNNAGVFCSGTAVTQTEAEWDRIIGINLTGAFLCMKYAIPEMVRGGGGSVINVSSEAGLVGIGGMCAYTASKHGMIALTRTAAVDFVGDGVRVNAVCPGRTATPLVEAHIASAADPVAERIRLTTDRPMMRIGRVDEIASAILYFASDESSYATGAVLAVDGGYTAR